MVFVCEKCQKERKSELTQLASLMQVVQQRIWLYNAGQILGKIKPGIIPSALLRGLSAIPSNTFSIVGANGQPIKKREVPLEDD